MPDLRKLIKYEETLAANAKEDDPISILYKRNTVSSRAKLGDKAKEKEQQVQQMLGVKTTSSSSSKHNMEAGDHASSKRTSQPDSVFTKSSRKESVTDFATAFCNQLCLDDEKSRGDADKPRHQYKLGMQKDVSSDESCPSQRTKWSNRSTFPRSRPLSAAMGKIHKNIKTYFIIIPNCVIYYS